MLQIYQADLQTDKAHIHALFWEYLQWANTEATQELGINFDVGSIIEQNMLKLTQFMPPKGRLLLAKKGNHIAGIACLHQIRDQTCEIKRMYVRPQYRKQGIGRALIENLIEEASEIGYSNILLDSARFMKAAHHLYRSIGFYEISPYPESEIPKEFQQFWIFMEKIL